MVVGLVGLEGLCECDTDVVIERMRWYYLYLLVPPFANALRLYTEEPFIAIALELLRTDDVVSVLLVVRLGLPGFYHVDGQQLSRLSGKAIRITVCRACTGCFIWAVSGS